MGAEGSRPQTQTEAPPSPWDKFLDDPMKGLGLVYYPDKDEDEEEQDLDGVTRQQQLFEEYNKVQRRERDPVMERNAVGEHDPAIPARHSPPSRTYAPPANIGSDFWRADSEPQRPVVKVEDDEESWTEQQYWLRQRDEDEPPLANESFEEASAEIWDEAAYWTRQGRALV